MVLCFDMGDQVLMTMSAGQMVCRRLNMFGDGVRVCKVHLPE